MISPQRSADGSGFFSEVMEYQLDYLRCIDPNYKSFIDPIAIRRMSRLIRMGIASARLSLADAGISMPDAIITGTGLGSVEDTEKILHGLLAGEQLLNPTPFIQSTYNTISSQIAIHLKCTAYNSTYVHRSFSFESGLQDGMMQLQEGNGHNMLVGGIDEMTLNHLTIIRRLGMWKKTPESNLALLNHATPGMLAGEGAGFFTLSDQKSEQTYAQLHQVVTLFKPGNSEFLADKIAHYLKKQNIEPSDVDLVLSGIAGDQTQDHVYYQLANTLFSQTALGYYKHLCGEYHTASAFGLWVASNILKHQIFPTILKVGENEPKQLQNILLINHWNNVNVSFMLVSKVD